MGPQQRKAGTLVAAIAVVVALASAAVPAARACGAFFSRRDLEAARRPSLAFEQALIVWDETSRREHFIREVAFRRTSEPFGFVVPTPSLPEVAAVAKSPFPTLRADFPYEGPRGWAPPGSGTGQGFGRGRGVEVLGVKKVGSFTSFVLAATDAAALTGWLKRNAFETSPTTDRWLAHYVAQRFHFVAMRHEPPPAGKAPPLRTSSETIRISFDTPAPFYPYREPAPVGPRRQEPRMLEVWLVTDRLRIPVAVRALGGAIDWARPLAEGHRHEGADRALLEQALGKDAAILPAGTLHVQRFIDQKRSREGWGDVVFVPQDPLPPAMARMPALERLLSTVDPALPPSTGEK